MASIPSELSTGENTASGFSDRPTGPLFTMSPWKDERYVAHDHEWFLVVSGQDVLAHAPGRAEKEFARTEDWSLEVTFDLMPPAPRGHWGDVACLAREIGTLNVLPMLVGRQRWVAWRPARPAPYLEMILDQSGQRLSLDVRQLPVEDFTRADWNALFDGFKLMHVVERHVGGRPHGSRGGIDQQTWREKARELRSLVRHGKVSMRGALTRLELGISPTTGWTWIKDLDQDEPE